MTGKEVHGKFKPSHVSHDFHPPEIQRRQAQLRPSKTTLRKIQIPVTRRQTAFRVWRINNLNKVEINHT